MGSKLGQIVHVGGGSPPDFDKIKPKGSGKKALVLGGGGISGAAFEIGALLALNDVLVDFSATDFDMFVGTSAGAFLSACLVNGVTPEDFARSQLGASRADLPGITRKQILKPFPRRLGKGSLAVAGALRKTAIRLAKNATNSSLVDTFFSVTDGMSSWRIYTTQGLEEYLRGLFSFGGRTNEFGKLDRELYITATDLDTAERVVFGEDGGPRASISQAVSASAAIPIIYEPVGIGGREYLDGGLRSATNLDVAVAHGAEVIVLINPLVPYLHDTRYLLRATGEVIEHVSDGGLGRVISQVFRAMAQSQLDKELELIRLNHPNVDVLLIEPRRDDDQLFVLNLMDYSARLEVATNAFEQVAVDLVTHFPSVRDLLAKAGIKVSKELLVEQLEDVLAGGTSKALAPEETEESA